MYFRIIATLALSFVFYIGSSQVKYHRLYETTLNDQSGMNDTIFFHMSSTTISGDVYAMGTKRAGDLVMGYEDLSIIFTKHDDKGNIDWSKELDLGQDTVKFLGVGSVGDFAFNGAQDSILFTIEVEINGERSELFGKLDAGGNEIDLKTVGGLPFSVSSGSPKVTPFINQSDLLVTSGIQPTISRIGLGDDLIWSRSYEFINTSGDSSISFITDITTTVDSTIVVSGFGEGLGGEFVVAELDSNGLQLWAESYTFDVNNLINIYPTAVAPLSDGSFAVAGYYSASPVILENGFISIIDSAGTILLSKKLYISENSTTISNLIEGADGTLWMSGIANIVDSTRYFTTNINLDGTVNWTTIYPEQEAGFGPSATTSLLGVQSSGGATLVGHGMLDDLPVMQVMKHDAAGETSCSDTIPIILEDLIVVDDTLTSSVDNGGIFLDSIDFELNAFGGFSVPNLSIDQYPPFCPNEFIDTFLVAVVSGGVAEENISYLWSTDETNDTINIMVEPMMMPQYTVTVTITEDVCYTMCDTIDITRIPLPGITIAEDRSRYCDEKLVVLNTTYMPGTANETYMWETGETTPSIEVTQSGTYSVTVTDDCNETDDNEITVFIPDALGVAIIENVSFDIFCNNDGKYKLSAEPMGGVPIFTYLWSTGETSREIFVGEDGNYSITLTDDCGDTATDSKEVSIIKAEPTEGEITFELVCDPDNNALSRIIFDASTNIENIENAIVKLDIFDAEDQSISISQIIIPTEPLVLGNYYAVLRICDNIELATLTVNATALCGGLIQYPIAFFPGGEDEDSKTFGPIPNDTLSVVDLISDLEFKVFNRWGETVFESNDLLDAWDGSHKGDPAPSEVYIWYASYIVEGVQMLDKGDVTLIR